MERCRGSVARIWSRRSGRRCGDRRGEDRRGDDRRRDLDRRCRCGRSLGVGDGNGAVTDGSGGLEMVGSGG